jgi:hypothetical protein
VLPKPGFGGGHESMRKKKVNGEPWFQGLMLKMALNKDFYCNKCTVYIKIETLLEHYYIYSTLFIEITQSI